MYSFRRRISYAKAMNHGEFAEVTHHTPEITSISGIKCREVRRTLKAVLLAANGVEAWFPMFGLSETDDGDGGRVFVCSGFRPQLNAEQRALLGE